MPKLLTHKVNELEDSADLSSPGDVCIRQTPLYNSTKVIHAIILKCPFCNMDMMSTERHTVTKKKSWIPFSKKMLISVSPKLCCPYNPHHTFLISRSRIKKVK